MFVFSSSKNVLGCSLTLIMAFPQRFEGIFPVSSPIMASSAILIYKSLQMACSTSSCFLVSGVMRFTLTCLGMAFSLPSCLGYYGSAGSYLSSVFKNLQPLPPPLHPPFQGQHTTVPRPHGARCLFCKEGLIWTQPSSFTGTFATAAVLLPWQN